MVFNATFNNILVISWQWVLLVEETSGGLVKFMDLTIPQYGLPIYDWIVSLEVAEHIPSQFESVYLDNVFRHAREGIILSWAVPGQNGLSHVDIPYSRQAH
jgi:hypothetical protein